MICIERTGKVMAEKTNAEKILENALGPKRARGDSGEMEQHPIADQIEAAKLAAKEESRASTTGFGFRTVQLLPGNSD